MRNQKETDPRLVAIRDICDQIRSENKNISKSKEETKMFFNCGWNEYLFDSEIIKLNDQLPFYWRSRNPFCGKFKNLQDPEQKRRIQYNQMSKKWYYKQKAGD